MPLSPESDVSVSPIEPKSNSKIIKESKNEPISKVAKIVKEESKSTPTRVAGKNDKSKLKISSSVARGSGPHWVLIRRYNKKSRRVASP